MDRHDPSLEGKAAFFQSLKTALDDDDDDDEEFGAKEEQLRQASRGIFFKRQSPGLIPIQHAIPRIAEQLEDPRRDATPRRVASLPAPLHGEASRVIKATPAGAANERGRLRALLNQQSLDGVGETPVPDSNRPAQRLLGRSDSTPLPGAKRVIGNVTLDSPSLSMVQQKRRRKDSGLKMRPDAEQIFKHLAFFYVPDDDIAPARRIRITKAREHGAVWTRDVATATHVVVEKDIHFKDIENIISGARREGAPAVVNTDYPIDCIQFKAILDCDQKKYQLQGQPSGGGEPPPAASSLESAKSDKSLQLKAPPNNPKRWDYVAPAGTPSRSDEASQRSVIAGTQISTDSQPVILAAEEVGQSRSPQSVAHTRMGDACSAVQNDKPAKLDQATDHDDKQKPNDELSDYISMVQEYRNVPLENEEDDMHSATDVSEGLNDRSDYSGSDDDPMAVHNNPTLQSGRKQLALEDRFACNQASSKDARTENPNAKNIEILQSMLDYYDRVGDHWRTMGYRKAIGTLKRQDVKISTAEEAFKLPSIGQRLAQKIEEIVVTNKLQRLQYAQDEPTNKSVHLFLGIYGVGMHQTQQWIAQGFRTLDDLKEKAKLSPNQLVGIEHYDDLNTRMPRSEVEALGAVVKKAAARIDADVETIIGGSYRRGSESCSDIDFIVTKPHTQSSADICPFLDKLVRRLESDGFLVARLASSRSATGGSKWHGCCVLPRTKGVNDNGDYRPVWRRIDFLLVAASEMGAALIYFTGDDIFNRSMRLLASKKGMRLNQRGLYRDVMRATGTRAKVTEGELVEGRDERRIFEILGVKWREPHERWC